MIRPCVGVGRGTASFEFFCCFYVICSKFDGHIGYRLSKSVLPSWLVHSNRMRFDVIFWEICFAAILMHDFKPAFCHTCINEGAFFSRLRYLFIPLRQFIKGVVIRLFTAVT